MTNIITISINDSDTQRIKKIAKRLSIESIQYNSVIIRDSVKIMEKLLFPGTVLKLEKSYVNNEGLIELKEGIKNNPSSDSRKVKQRVLELLQEINELKVENKKLRSGNLG